MAEARDKQHLMALAEVLDAHKASTTKRRRLPDGNFYTKEDIDAWYQDDSRKAQQMWDAGAPEPTDECGMYDEVAKALWPRTPRILFNDGFYHMAAAVVPSKEAIEAVGLISNGFLP